MKGRAPGDLPRGDVSQHKAQLVQEVPHLKEPKINQSHAYRHTEEETTNFSFMHNKVSLKETSLTVMQMKNVLTLLKRMDMK